MKMLKNTMIKKNNRNIKKPTFKLQRIKKIKVN